ncbi:hypothetical protein ABZ454_36580 [Streptomyces sp. NPDC005803]|uniref:hypothetical protein n=1 Tax=Streptomyces sp. NPDC005803 TaxID=3154297 RepID=UPI0033D5A136
MRQVFRYGTPAALTADDIKYWAAKGHRGADKGHRRAGPAARVPFWGKKLRG